MRRVFDEQTCPNFSGETSLKVVQESRAKYAWIDASLEANPRILWINEELWGDAVKTLRTLFRNRN